MSEQTPKNDGRFKSGDQRTRECAAKGGRVTGGNKGFKRATVTPPEAKTDG